MSDQQRSKAPTGDLASFERGAFLHEGKSYEVYRKGQGPAVIVITEMPGISPMVLGFADRVVGLGCSVVLPDLFGVAGRDPLARGALSVLQGAGTIARACVRSEFSVFVANRASPVISWLQALARAEHERCGGPGVGVVGMCFTGGFALAMATDPRVLAPVLSQPSLPLGLGHGTRHSIDCGAAELERVAQRCEKEGLRVLGLRFDGDPLVPPERFAFLREKLGDGFLSVELPQSAGHPKDPMIKHHSVLTTGLIDEPGEPTREALDQVLALFRTRLLPGGPRSAPQDKHG